MEGSTNAELKMPDTIAVGRMARECGFHFVAGFLAAALAIAAMFTVFQFTGRNPAKAHPDVLNRLSFAASEFGYLPLPRMNTTAIAKSKLQQSVVDHTLIQPQRMPPQRPSPLQQTAAYEIAGRFAERDPSVATSSVVPALITEPSRVASDSKRQLDRLNSTSLLGRSEPDENQTQQVTAAAKKSEIIAKTVTPLKAVQQNVAAPSTTSPVPESGNTPSVAVSLPPASLQLKLARSRGPTTRIAFPLDLNPSWSDKSNAGVLVGGLPSGVTLSTGRRTALGLWKLRSIEARTTQIVVTSAAPSQFELTVLLIDPEGLVVNGIVLEITMREAEPIAATKEATHALTTTPAARSLKRRGSSHAISHRHKFSNANQFVSKANISKRIKSLRVS